MLQRLRGRKGLEAIIKKIPGKVLISINKKVGFRLVTKAGEKGIVNLMKVTPVAGGIVGGAFDVATTKVIARNAQSIFIKGVVPEGKKSKKSQVEYVEIDV